MTGKPLNKALAAAMSAEPDVAMPAGRARASSFTSVIADLKVGDEPAARVMSIDGATPLFDLAATIGDAKVRFGNNIRPSIAAAQRRVQGAEYSYEISEMMTGSGVYLVALVTRKV